MPTILSFQWCSEKHPQEDFFLRDDERGIFLVADGVTRTPGLTGYPNPSPATMAAQRLLEGTHRALLNLPQTTEGLKEACSKGNENVRELNQELGLWEKPDFWEHDLAGAVFAGILLHETEFVWAFLTDCGAAQLSVSGQLNWITPDRLTPVRPLFPELSDAREQQVAIRRNFRNKPERGIDRTYGAFTGENAAMKYLEAGTRAFQPGDLLLVFSDGARHLVEDLEFRSLLRTGSSEEIDRYVALPEHCSHNDDKTLIVIRTA